MANDKGIEDSSGWRKNQHTHREESCVICKNTIVDWHCANYGCGWCASCGAKAKVS